MALRTHNLPSGRLKVRLSCSKWSDVSRCRKVRRKHCLHHGYPKKRDLDKFAEVMFQVGEWPLKLTIFFLNAVKCNFGEVEEAIFLRGPKALRSRFVSSRCHKMCLWWIC
jgi:hypothetical protein